MIVKPLRNKLTHDEARRYDIGEFGSKFDYMLDLTKEYQVYGLKVDKGLMWVEITDNDVYLVSVPAALFQIVEPGISNNWVVEKLYETQFVIRPKPLQGEFFIDDLSEGRYEAVKAFKKIRDSL